MKNVYIVVSGHYPMAFDSLGGARRYAAHVLRSCRETGLAMRALQRGKRWEDANDLDGFVVTLTEQKIY